MSDKGGCYAFFATMRHQKPCEVGITDDDIAACVAYAPKMCKYWLLVAEKEGQDKHLHCVLFPHIAQQRSNVCTLLTKHCLKGWKPEEIHNFKKWNRQTGTGAVKTLTSVDLIVGYLDGTYAKKIEDKFEIVDEHLPDDLSELEKWIPDVGKLKRRPNQRFHTLMNQMYEHFKVPVRSEKSPLLSLNLLQRIFYRLENDDVREAMCDPRIATAFIKRYHRWYNRYDHDDSYHPSCRREIESIEEMLQFEIDDQP